MSMRMRMDIASLLQAYRTRQCTPRQVVDQVLQAIRHAGDNPVWISRFDDALLYARADELAARDPASLPLYGIPFAIKDNIDVAGLATTAACPEFAYRPATSATVVQKLLDAGAVAIGKTNLDQFATGLVGTRSPYGICRNSFDPQYLSGGSSSGSAVAVALGQVGFALGTDTAGSGRVPAAFNNLVGYKPTLGHLSTRGVVPACRTLDAIAVFALTAADAASVTAVAGGVDAGDPWSRAAVNAPGRGWSQRAQFRVAVPRREQLEFFGNAGYAALFEAAAAHLAALGATLVTVDIDPLLRTARLLYEGPWVAERHLAALPLIESHPESLHPVTRRILEGGRSASAADAFAAQYRLRELQRAARLAVWDQADVLLLPTAGTHFRIDEEQAEPLQLNSHLGRYTNFVNLMDLAAVAVPAGFTPTGLPFGVSLIAPAWHDADLLAAADRLQRRTVTRLGATGAEFPSPRPLPGIPATIDVAVCGAHMSGLPLNAQLTARGAWLLAATRTAPCYQLYVLPGGPPQRPGMVRVNHGGAAIDIEVWRMPEEAFGSFMQLIPAPLGLGRIRLEAGPEVTGFLCESCATTNARDITALGGWRNWLAQQAS